MRDVDVWALRHGSRNHSRSHGSFVIVACSSFPLQSIPNERLFFVKGLVSPSRRGFIGRPWAHGLTAVRKQSVLVSKRVFRTNSCSRKTGCTVPL